MSARYLALGALALSAGAMAAMPEASPASAVTAAADCAAAAGPGTIDSTAIEQRGWKLASMSAKGKAIETPLMIYGKPAGGALIMLSRDTTSPQACIITGGLENADGFGAVADAFAGEFEPAGSKGDDRYFRIGKAIAILSPTGTAKEPAFRVAIMEPGVKK